MPSKYELITERHLNTSLKHLSGKCVHFWGEANL